MSPRIIKEMVRWSMETTIKPHFGLATRPLPLWEGPSAVPGPLKHMPVGLGL